MNDDTISRQMAIDVLEREKTYSTAYKDGYTQTDYFKQYNMGLTDGIKAIKALPSAQPKQGRWIKDSETGKPICSVCESGKPTMAAFSSVIEHKLKNFEIRYCYYCGARMDGEQNG